MANRENVTNEYRIHLRVTIGRKQKYYPLPLPLKITPEQWSGREDQWVKTTHPYDLRQWLLFFLVAVKETAEKAVMTLQQIINLKQQIEKEHILPLGRRAVVAQPLLDSLFSNPVITYKSAGETLSLSPKSTNNLIDEFVKSKILKEITGLQRGRVYAFQNYIDLFEK